MDGFLDLLRDNSSVLGRLVSTAVLIAVAVPLGAVLGRVARGSDPYARYYLRKASRYAVPVVLLVLLAVLWRPFAGRIGVVLGLAAAGVAFAMQEVIGALAGWVSILSSRQFRVGDRVQLGGVHGDVLDITPLRTRLLEIGSADEPESWCERASTRGGSWRRVKDTVTRRVLDRLAEAGLSVASSTQDITVHRAEES